MNPGSGLRSTLYGPPYSVERRPDPLSVIVAAVLLVASVATYVVGRRARAAGEEFAAKYELAMRRPEALAAARLEPSADQAAGVLAYTAVEDETGAVRWTGLTEEGREAWMRSLEKRGELLGAARDLALSAAAARPAWPAHRLLAAKLEYLAQRRAGGGGDVARWIVPMRAAIREAPAPGEWAFLVGAMLESWPRLGVADRAGLPVALKEAFRDPAMVGRAFPAAVAALGSEEAAKLVPEEPRLLRAMAEQRAAERDLAGAAAAWKRYDAAEKTARAEDLASLESRARMGDLDGVRLGCRGWVARHGVREVDTEEGRREVARVLELWPGDVEGDWRRDARGELARYFLDGRERAVAGEALARAVAALEGVPDPVRARVAVLAGDRYAWERLVENSEAAGTLEWTPFHLDLARAELAAGKPEAARAALARIAAAARTECAVLLTRREVTRAEKHAALTPGDDEAELAAAIAKTREQLAAVRELSPRGALPVCVDPEDDAKGALRVRLRAEEPVLLSWGWNDGRAGKGLAEGEVEILAPLAGLQGRAFLSARALAGASPKFVSAAIEASASSSWRLQAVAASEAPATQASVAGMAGMERLNSTKP